ncbi:MAG: murein biosynthesis integral membrane protein MurJ [Spirochaetes bacterium]|nr:MAG: murein biosynthesis integral membrane protein MurJ [Spirochaetota bacterium]
MAPSSLVRSTGIVAISTLASRILGFVRDMIVASYFGASGALDGFFVAFRIPNLLRRLVAEGALTVSFIPVYTDYLVNKGEREALELAQKTLSIMLIVLGGLVALGIVFSPEIVRAFAYGFEDEGVLALTVGLNRIMFPYLFLVGLVAFAMGVLNSHNYFFAPAFSPVLLNVGMIMGAVLFRGFFSEPLHGLAWGVILGGIFQAVTQVPDLVRSGFRMKFSLDLKHPGIRRIFRMIGAAVFGTAIYQVNIFMSTVIASLLPSGSISYLYYSDRLTEMVLGIFIVSIGNVILPEMSRITAKDDMVTLKKLYIRASNASLFLAVPAAAALMAVGTAVVSVLFMRGQFTAYHAEMTARALFCASFGIVPVALLRITTPTFYSLKDARTPVYAAAVSFVLNISAGYALMQTPLRHAGLSLANSISATVQVGILVYFLERKIGRIRFREMFVPAAKYLAASLGMVAVVFAVSWNTDWVRDSFLRRALMLGVVVAAGGATYFALCAAMGVEEIDFLVARVRALARRGKARGGME